MSASSAITIKQTQQEIAARLSQADPPLSDDDAQVSYAPPQGTAAPKCGCCCPVRLRAWGRRWPL
jgi:hypothetical protein